MAHIHGNNSGAVDLKSVAGGAKMMSSAMNKMGMAAMEKGGPAMMEGMGPMMKMGEGMMAGMGQARNPAMTKGMAYGVAATAGAGAGQHLLKKVLTHPVTLIGIGFLVGYLAHIYRKSLITSPEKGKASTE
jgi:hypothetical protein